MTNLDILKSINRSDTSIFAHSFKMEKIDCKFCGVSEFTQYLRRHESICRLNPNRKVELRCDYCNKTFTRAENLRAHTIKKHDPALTEMAEMPEDSKKLFKVTMGQSIDSSKLRYFQQKFTIELTKKGLAVAKTGRLVDILMPAINEQVEKLRGKPYLAQLSLNTASLDYPITSGVHLIDELDVNQLFDSAERTDQSEKLIQFSDDNPYVHVNLFVRERV